MKRTYSLSNTVSETVAIGATGDFVLAHPSVRKHGRCRPAFTLIEVLATMVLLAIVLPVAMRGLSIGLAAASSAKHLTEASTLADTKLNDLLSQNTSSSTGMSGSFAPDHPDYQWSCQSAPRDYNTTEMRVTVSWLERGQARSFVVSTMTYQTADSLTNSSSSAGVTP